MPPRRSACPGRDLPKTGKAFAQLVEPGCGLSRQEAIAAAEAPGRAYDTRYALRLEPDRVVMVEDAGRWQPDVQGRPAFARGQLRVDPASGARELLPTVLRARSELLCSIQNGINEALRVSQTCTLIVGSVDGDEADLTAEIARRSPPDDAPPRPVRRARAEPFRPGAHLLPRFGCAERHEAPRRAPEGSAGCVLPAPGRRLRAGPYLQGDEASALRRAGTGLGPGMGRSPQPLRPAPRQAVAGGRAGAVRLDRRPQRPQPDARLPADGGGADAGRRS